MKSNLNTQALSSEKKKIAKFNEALNSNIGKCGGDGMLEYYYYFQQQA